MWQESLSKDADFEEMQVIQVGLNWRLKLGFSLYSLIEYRSRVIKVESWTISLKLLEILFTSYPGRPEVATGSLLIGFTLQNIEVLKSVPLLFIKYPPLQVSYSHFMKSCKRKGMYTAMVKDPFKKCDRVDTFCALLVDLGTLDRFQNKTETGDRFKE